MRWFAASCQNVTAQESAGRRWLPRTVILVVAVVASLSIAACGSPTVPQLPAGAYSNTTYNFHIAYPRNWKANPFVSTPAAGDTSPSAIPFTLVITRTGDTHGVAAFISTCTITVMNLKNSDIAKSAKSLASDKTLQPVKIGGVQGYKSSPLVQNVPNSQISVTHTDYYVLHGDYEYQLSTDSVKGDNADGDLQSIIASFAFGA